MKRSFIIPTLLTLLLPVQIINADVQSQNSVLRQHSIEIEGLINNDIRKADSLVKAGKPDEALTYYKSSLKSKDSLYNLITNSQMEEILSLYNMDKLILQREQRRSMFHQACLYISVIIILALLLTNIHIPNLLKGKIYQGKIKTVCVPGLNCYSCPAAAGACPIGAFQAVVGSSNFKFSYYITGFFILLGVTLGRFICGFLCPFGWFQDLLHKIPGKKFSTARLKPLRYLKYIILIVFVIALPMLVTNSIGMGDPFFCKYICPQGVLEGAIPLSLGNSAIRSALGRLFSFKCLILITVVVLSILFYRPFCKWICPLGAIYSLFNKISFLNIKVEGSKCVGCNQCSKACKMDIDVCKTPNHPECIRCGACIKACPKDAIQYQFLGKTCPKKEQQQSTITNR